MTFYLSSPSNQMQADHCRGQPVLLSYGTFRPWVNRFVPSFSKLLVDSGAFSVLNTATGICVDAFAEWASNYPNADAVASLDSIEGDWELGMRNWEKYPTHFPTFHDTDPWECLDAILEKKPTWLGLGMKPPRDKSDWLDETLERIPPGIHVHGWALIRYADRGSLNSFDSTNWVRESWQIAKSFPWLTSGEALEIMVKRYERMARKIRNPKKELCLFNTP